MTVRFSDLNPTIQARISADDYEQEVDELEKEVDSLRKRLGLKPKYSAEGKVKE